MSNPSENQSADQKAIAQAEQIQPMWKIIFRQFLDHKAAVVGLCVIIFYLLVALFAPVIKTVTGLDPESQNPLNRYKPPFSRVTLSADKIESRITEFEAKNDVKPLQQALIDGAFVESTTPEDALYDLMYKDMPEVQSILQQINTPVALDLIKITEGFFTFHILGTDELGRDVLMRLVYGTRVSMGVGLMVAISSAFLGLLIGSLAGFYGGFVDALLMRITDSLLSLPIMPFLIVLAAIDMNKLPLFSAVVGSQNESVFKMVLILLMFSWMTTARLVRGSVLSLREREFVLAAKTLGAKDSTIIIRHMFPNVIAPMLVSVTLGVGSSIILESTLSFLGLGIQQPMASWGNMLFNALELISEAPTLAIIPGVLISSVTISFSYLGDGLQDAIDPKSIRR